MQLVQIYMEVLHALVIADSLEMEQSAQVMYFFLISICHYYRVQRV